MSQVSDKIWFKDFSVLFNQDRMSEFIPSEDQSDIEKLNSIVRFSVIAAVILSLYNKSIKPFLGAIFIMVITFIVYNYSADKSKLEMLTEEEQKDCVKPTRNNPFMNVLLSDYIDNPKRAEACKYYDESSSSKEIKDKINENFEYNLYSDFEDMFGRKNSSRQFYTMPATTIPSDRESFQNWLYKRGKSCKEDNSACVNNIYEPVAGKPIFFQEIAKTS